MRVHLVRGRSVAVSSGHALASTEAVRVMQDGGNLIDAAVAGAMVLSVVLPYACGIGGDLYLLYYDAGTGKFHGLNGTGAAPAGAVAERFPNGIPQTGIHSATVPGVVAAWEDALTRLGSRSLGNLLQPAIRYAAGGFPAHHATTENALEQRDLLAKNAEAARLYLPAGRPHASGEAVLQPDLGRSLSAIAERGAREFYEGALAEVMLERIAALGGSFSPADLARHRSLWQEPVCAGFHGHEIFTMPPNSVGATLLNQLLALEANGIAADDPAGASFIEKGIAAWRWARDAGDGTIGDPADTEAPVREALERTKARPPSLAAVGARRESAPPSGDTSNLVIMDAGGSAVSLVQSVSGPFASGIVLEGTGVLLNNRMRGFHVRDASRNRVAPGRRPAHTLVPALVARQGSVTMSIGTPGAAGQTITLAQVLCRILAHGEPPQQAIAAPRWSVSPSGRIIVEGSAAPELIEALRRSEPAIEVSGERNLRFGSVKAAWTEGRFVSAAADHRRVAGAHAA
jgi:gamma-glutamyltranspeptidase/glutathione hydrolase